MRNTLASIHLWTYALLIVALMPLASYCGSLWNWTPGAASLVLFLIPTCAAAASGRPLNAYGAALISAVGCFAEVYFLRNDDPVAFSPALSIGSSVVLLAAASVVVAVVENLGDRVEELEEQTTQYVRDLYHRERDSADASELAANSNELNAPSPTSMLSAMDDESVSEDEATVNYPMLLLTLQNIGRRVSTNLDLDTLVPTIVSTAKASLKCCGCDVYFWNSREQLLSNALPDPTDTQTSYVPQPSLGMVRWVLEHRQILTRRAVENDYSLHALLDEDPNAPDAIAPLAVGGELLGLLLIHDVAHDSPTFVRSLYILANIYALGVKNAQLFKRIEDMARRDGLTGLLNHASFQSDLQKLMQQPASDGPVTLLMCDIDHFKKFNDTYGHQAGDYVLREVARLWNAVLPDGAILARYGGEEFICALPASDRERGRKLAELMREQLESCSLTFKGRPLSVTASFGVAQFESTDQSTQDLIQIADAALYEAKKSGRNRVACSSHELQTVSPQEQKPV